MIELFKNELAKGKAMERCRHCGSERIVKTGHRDGQQKWRCKDCGKFQGAEDRREKYSEKERKMAISLYLEGCGFRRIARILSDMFEKHFCYQTVILWIKKEAKEIEAAGIKAKKEIQILEMDELYTYIKKNQIKSEYGLLSIGTRSVLLRLRSETRADKL